MNEDKVIRYNYKFVFENGNTLEIDINIDADNITLINDEIIEKPDWTKHEKFCCPDSSCKEINIDYCPLALNINRFIKLFGNIPSYEPITAYVETNNRTYSKKTSIQEAFGSLLGIIMPTSGCPTLGKLKPLVKYHLPFASIEETEFRVFSMYMIAQYLRKQNGKQTDWDMEGLQKLYNEIQIINKNIANKIADLEKMDASINSVIVLNNFAHSVTFTLEENLTRFEKLFKNWLDE